MTSAPGASAAVRPSKTLVIESGAYTRVGVFVTVTSAAASTDSTVTGSETTGVPQVHDESTRLASSGAVSVAEHSVEAGRPSAAGVRVAAPAPMTDQVPSRTTAPSYSQE